MRACSARVRGRERLTAGGAAEQGCGPGLAGVQAVEGEMKGLAEGEADEGSDGDWHWPTLLGGRLTDSEERRNAAVARPPLGGKQQG